MASSLFGDIMAGLLPGVGQLSDVGAALVGFFTTITDGRMWRSLAWIILGVTMILVGLLLFVRERATGLVGNVLKEAA